MSGHLGIRYRAARQLVRGVNLLSRLSGRGSGTVLGGTAGMLLAPKLLDRLSAGRSFILVSGTNGKTTTASMISAGWGGTVATNATGANMPAGHVAALAASQEQRAVLEVDEAWLPQVIAATSPRVVVLLNLSRDQLDRANEVRQLADRWRRSLSEPANRDVVVVANANDPMVVFAARDAQKVRWCDVPTAWRSDASSCPLCTKPIVFVGRDWYCTCGFARPTQFVGVLDDGLTIDGESVGLDLAMPGEFNRSNATMALVALREVDRSLKDAVEHINTISSVAGRFSRRSWHGHPVQLMLAKNPAGFGAMLSTLAPTTDDVWIAINSRIADGRDPSWLYDVNFEVLRGRVVYCLGDRRLDLATRLMYANVEFVVTDDVATLPHHQTPTPVLANYTAFNDILGESQS